jgi:hypothetical protein
MKTKIKSHGSCFGFMCRAMASGQSYLDLDTIWKLEAHQTKITISVSQMKKFFLFACFQMTLH